MVEEKRMVKIVLVRELRHNLEAELTKEEYEKIKHWEKESNNQDGADLMFLMKTDSQEQPDDWKDEIEEIESEWEE